MWTFAEYLRHERLSRNLTMEVAAARLGISPQFISLLENGRRHPSAKLVVRAAEFFGSDANYVGFLAQRMPIEQKRALAESPATPDYIPTELRARARSVDGEERLLRQLLLPAGALPPELDAPYYAAPSNPSPPAEVGPARDIMRLITADDGVFSPKARAWAAFHTAYVTRVTDGRASALPEWQALAAALDADTSRPYGPTIRRLVAMQRTLALQDLGRNAEAAEQAARAAKYAADADDPDAVACVAYTVASIHAGQFDPAGAAAALTDAVGIEGLSSSGRARCSSTLAVMLSASHEFAQARDVAEDAVPLLRTTALDIPTPERSSMLFATQAIGAEALAELGDLDTADAWLNRARSLRPRLEADTGSDARLTIAASLLFIARGRPAMARRRVAPLLVADDTPPHMLRRALRVEGQAAALANDSAGARAAAAKLLECAPTGVAIQDMVAVGWALLTRCEACLQEGATVDATRALALLSERIVSACDAAPQILDTAALVALRADVAALENRIDGG